MQQMSHFGDSTYSVQLIYKVPSQMLSKRTLQDVCSYMEWYKQTNPDHTNTM